MDASAFIVPTLTAVASFFGAWLAARFALRRFYQEKLWERKTVAYTTIFEALHDMERWFDTHLDAYFAQTELDERVKTEMWEDYKKAKVTLSRRLAAEVWLIPDACQQRLVEMNKVLDSDDPNWFTMLDSCSAEVSVAIKDLTKIVRRDLRVRTETRAQRLIALFEGLRRIWLKPKADKKEDGLFLPSPIETPPRTKT
jgi:hypothetical protein